MTDIHTDPALLRALQDAVKRELSSEERRRQRVSFILGSLGKDSTVTEEQIEKELQRLEGDAA